MGMLYCELAVPKLHCCMCLHDHPAECCGAERPRQDHSTLYGQACTPFPCHSRPAAGLTEDDGIDDGNGPNRDLTRRAEGCIDDYRDECVIKACRHRQAQLWSLHITSMLTHVPR